MGEVYRARGARLGRDVALELLPAAFASDPERQARFQCEYPPPSRAGEMTGRSSRSLVTAARKLLERLKVERESSPSQPEPLVPACQSIRIRMLC
jgi:hypothetical protein